MECNKDEALRSLDIAEKKFGVQDYAGAKKFVIKAQQLFPALEGAAQMLAVVEVHNTAQGKALGGEHDWYGMLQADPYADEATIRKQYRKLAFTLHPDKNKFVGAESAFKLIGEAWTVLSDKDKRFTYNEKRGIKVQNMNFNQAPQGLNGFNNLHQASSSAAASRPYSAATFWTACPFCKMQYQYFRTYENFHLLCQKCKRGYVARDVNAMNGFPWSNTYGNFGPQFRPESLFTKFATSSKSGSSFPNGFVNGNAYSHMSSSATVSAATSATATATATAAASTKMTGATTSSGSAGASALAAEFVRQMYQKAKKDRVESQKEEKRKEKEKEKQEREKEKEERRNEREAQKKLREDEKKREAMLKLLMKRKEMEEREAARRKKADKSKTKLKKNDSDENEETDEDQVMEENEEDADSPDRIFSNAHDARSEEAFKVELRRSSRMKRNVSYRLDGSDDENAETSQYLKRPKFETGAAFENGKQAESWRPLGCQSQIADDGLIQNIQEMSSTSGEVLLKTVKVDEPHKLELAGKFRSFLKEYVLPRSHEGKHVSEDNKAERDFRSLKKCAAIKKEGKKLCSDKKKVAKVDKSGNSVKKFQTKVKICEPSEQSQCPPSQVHELVNEDGVACQKQAGLDISPPSSPKSDHEEASLKNITVPDPDFHNFDADRTESKLSMGQLWAVYDDKDGMPRFYCRITRILSLDPFKVRVRWLDPDKSSEEVIKWVDSDHLLTCGELKLSNSYETFEQINVFSHVMLADVSQKGLIKMYPKKGEVWALYRGWTQEWFQQSSDGNERNYTYEMVEVVTDFSEEIGVYMILLVKVQGFKTLFEQAALEKSESLHCTPKEVFKFSHRVPAHRKCGAEAPNVPEGCWELDPASTPLELIYGQASESQRAK